MWQLISHAWLLLVSDRTLIRSKAFYVCSFIPLNTRSFQGFNPRTYTQIHTPTVLQGGGGGVGLMEPHPRVFDKLQYFETILPLVESLLKEIKELVFFQCPSKSPGVVYILRIKALFNRKSIFVY